MILHLMPTALPLLFAVCGALAAQHAAPLAPYVDTSEPPHAKCGVRLLYVTGYRAISDRATWNMSVNGISFERSLQEYLTYFLLFAQSTWRESPLVAYLQDAVRSQLPPLPASVWLRSAERDAPSFYSELETEQRIMRSSAYQAAILAAFRALPEHTSPAYTLTTHEKVNWMLAASKQFTAYTHLAWIDMGAFRSTHHLPHNVQLCRLPKRRLLFLADLEHLSKPRTPREVLASPEVIAICGTTYVAPRELMPRYHQVSYAASIPW